MAIFLENIGLGFFEEEESILGLFKMSAAQGRAILGYNDTSYIHYVMDDAQLTTIAQLNEQKKTMNILRTDTHSLGNAIWKVRVVSVLEDEEDTHYKKIMVKNHNGRGMAVVNVIGSEVLPSYLPDEEITMQMVAFPINVQYFQDEEDYASIYPTGANGGKLMIGEGMVFPYGLLDNEEEENRHVDLVSVWGKIKGVYKAITKFEGHEKDECPHFIRCVIETQFGDLDIVHAWEVLGENNNLDHIKPGCICAVQAVLSGDVSIYEYENGILKDHETNLHALAYAMVKGEPERIRCILSEKFSFFSETSKTAIHDIEEFVRREHYINEQWDRIEARFATIAQNGENSEGLYPVGERCFVLRYGDEEEFSSIVFIENDENNNICKIHISQDPRYVFDLDMVDDELDDWDDMTDKQMLPGIQESILARARISLMVDSDLDDEEILEKVNSSDELIEHAEEAVSVILKQEDKKNALKNALIYFYILGFLCALNDLDWSLNIADEFNEPVNLHHYGAFQRITQEAFDLAGRFQKDMHVGEEDDNYREELVDALALVEFLGRHLADLVRDKFEYSVIEFSEQDEPMQWCYSAKELEKELGKTLKDKIIQNIYVTLSGYIDSCHNNTDCIDLSCEAGGCIIVFDDIVLDMSIHVEGQLSYRFVPKEMVTIQTVTGAVPTQYHGIENGFFDIKNHDISYHIDGAQLQNLSVKATNIWAFSDIGQDENLLEAAAQKNDLPAEVDLFTDKCIIRIIADELEYYRILLEDNEE